MRCPYCGKELINGASFCDGCGARLEMPPQYQPPMNYGYPQMPPKKSKGPMIAIIVLSAVIVIGLVLVICFFVLGGNGDENNTTSNNVANNTINTNTNTNTNTQQHSSNKTTFQNYELTVPNGYTVGSYNGNDYIESSECVIMYLPYQLTYETIVSNQTDFIKSFEEQGFTLESSSTKQYSGTKYFVMTGVLNNIHYGYMFGYIGGSTPFFVTITGQNLGEIKEQWFIDAGRFFATAK